MAHRPAGPCPHMFIDATSSGLAPCFIIRAAIRRCYWLEMIAFVCQVTNNRIVETMQDITGAATAQGWAEHQQGLNEHL